MSLTARDCSHCGDSVFADDPHTCVEDSKPVTAVQHFPKQNHWAILIFNGNGLDTYLSYQTKEAWNNALTKLAKKETGPNTKRKFVAFRASAPAEVTLELKVDVKFDKITF